MVPAAQLYPATAIVPSDPSQYGFESSTQGWATTGGMLTAVASSTDRAFAGARSLRVSVNGAAGSQRVRVASPATPAGANITFRIYIPSGSALASLQPYVLQGAGGGWAWTGSWRAASSLTANQWNAITVQVPSTAAVPLAELGVEITTQASWTGAVYVDAVAW